MAGTPVVVCELAYYTGAFAAYGKSLTNDVRFPIEEVINLDPPLGRTWELLSEDIGDDHEGQAAKTCLEQHGAEILVSIAHQYRTYRDYMMEYWQENDCAARAVGPRRRHPGQPRRQGRGADLPGPGPGRGPGDLREPVRVDRSAPRTS